MKYSPAAVFGLSRLLNQFGVFIRHSQKLLSFLVSVSSPFVPAWLRQELYAAPVKRLEPLRVVIRICAAPAPELSAPGVDVETVISSTESIIGRIYMKNPSPLDRLSCTLMPSMVMVIARFGRPLMVEARVLPVAAVLRRGAK